MFVLFKFFTGFFNFLSPSKSPNEFQKHNMERKGRIKSRVRGEGVHDKIFANFVVDFGGLYANWQNEEKSFIMVLDSYSPQSEAFQFRMQSN